MQQDIDLHNFFAMCRMPDEDTALALRCKRTEQYLSLSDIDSKSSGFIVAPFNASKEYPVFVFHNINVTEFNPASLSAKDLGNNAKISFLDNREAYGQSFNYVKSLLDRGICSKIVLSRRVSACDCNVDPMSLFAHACKQYPHCFVSLINIPDKGYWLTATPELLYRQKGNVAHTMAMAGTMTWEELTNGKQWSEKNLREQQMVADYITTNLNANNFECKVESQHSAKAGHLAHVCSDISIEDVKSTDSLRLLDILHPTPAVAGIPLNEALESIGNAEGKDARGYYSGFCGFLNHSDYGTRCYVALRLLNITPDKKLTLFAGGGILPESTEEAEWQETELKLLAMKRIL